jgi:type IV secretory pathway VirB10-like protein
MADPTGLTLPKPPHRVSTRVLWAAGGFLLLLLAGIVWGYQYQQSQNKLQTAHLDEPNPDAAESARTTNFVNDLDKGRGKPTADYRTVSAPVTVPDLGAPQNPAGTQPGTVTTQATIQSYPAPRVASPLALAWQREEHAMTSAPQDIIVATQPAYTSYTPASYAPAIAPNPEVREREREVAKAEPVMRRLPPEGEYIVTAGTWIPAQLGQRVISDLAGDMEAVTTETIVMVKDGKKIVLIPQKSRLIGAYDSRVGVGQTRILQIWSKIILPDNSYINLTDLSGMDKDGAAGMAGKVNNHTAKLIRDAAITTAFAIGISATQQRNQNLLASPSFGDAASMAVGQQLANVGSQQFARNFNRQPTITAEPGKEFLAYVNRTIVLDGPYAPMGARQ